MRKIKKIFLFTILTVIFVALLSSCNKKNTALTGVSFLEDVITIEKYEVTETNQVLNIIFTTYVHPNCV